MTRGVGEASEQLTHESGLADAGLAADQGDGWGFVLVGKAAARRSSSAARPTMTGLRPGTPDEHRGKRTARQARTALPARHSRIERRTRRRLAAFSNDARCSATSVGV